MNWELFNFIRLATLSILGVFDRAKTLVEALTNKESRGVRLWIASTGQNFVMVGGKVTDTSGNKVGEYHLVELRKEQLPCWYGTKRHERCNKDGILEICGVWDNKYYSPCFVAGIHLSLDKVKTRDGKEVAFAGTFPLYQKKEHRREAGKPQGFLIRQAGLDHAVEESLLSIWSKRELRTEEETRVVTLKKLRAEFLNRGLENFRTKAAKDILAEARDIFPDYSVDSLKKYLKGEIG